ncbi:PREDICTED: glutamyl-tRNA(Gln) amidotransferase subunit B, mitochondrial-like [Priapulus caudatus]|uniref:Glutamyl-tRNA(Gln) amidotransferase subunit B, mitochondrial n=1 Tax=Priapulus caudatus TaxID=37621 RepID=A0ABM1F7L0_PRICU|nr:PREDICTED: glutamyl-tRNA(Gln) amidotransferase subunit B, mitochondrial-like [Priapulus caudatus]
MACVIITNIFKRNSFKKLGHFWYARSLSVAATRLKHDREWKAVIGIEIHAQIYSKSKLFSGSGTEYAYPVNNQVGLFDAAIPGTLPVINKRCVEAAVMTALALNCSVNKVSKFDRKHYFYADLPAGYQITQQRQPIATDGYCRCIVYNPAVPKYREPRELSVRIIQLQLEQDSGKSLHDEENGYTLVDLNRAGVGLMEIVTAPDMCDGEEAASLIKELQLIFKTIGTCNARMDEGSLRVDANISVHRPGEPLGVRTEVKNLNSVRFVAKAIDYEISRQIELLEDGGKVENETKAFDFKTGRTVSMRDKEMKQDYRFMPEPNLPPLRIYDSSDAVSHLDAHQVINVDDIRASIPTLPAAKRTHLVDVCGLPWADAIKLSSEVNLMEYFEGILRDAPHRLPKTAATILLKHVLRCVYKAKCSIADCNLAPQRVGEICDLIDTSKITWDIGAKLVDMVFEGETLNPAAIVEKNKWHKITDNEVILRLCQTAIDENPKAVRKYKEGKKRYFSTLIHHVQNKTEQCTDSFVVMDTLKQLVLCEYSKVTQES